MAATARPKIRLGDKAIVACGLDDIDWRFIMERLQDGTWTLEDLLEVTRSVESAPCRNGECDSTVSERKAVARALVRLRTIAKLCCEGLVTPGGV